MPALRVVFEVVGGRCGGWVPKGNQLGGRLCAVQLYVHGDRMPEGAHRRDGSFEENSDCGMPRPTAVLFPPGMLKLHETDPTVVCLPFLAVPLIRIYQ